MPRTFSLGNDVDCDLSETHLGLAVSASERSEQPVLEFRRGRAEQVLAPGRECELKS